MDPGLSDLLTCPRCGPMYGLILLPEERRDRRVIRGLLGCANCRERYPVESGVADLRVEAGGGAAEDLVAGVAGGGESMWAVPGEEALRLGALLGLEEARGTVLVAGPAAAFAGGLARLSGDVTVVGVGDDPGIESDAAVSAVLASTVLPFRTGSMAAVALTGRYGSLVAEGVRVVGRGGRFLVEPAPETEPSGWSEVLEPLARERSTFLAKRR